MSVTCRNANSTAVAGRGCLSVLVEVGSFPFSCRLRSRDWEIRQCLSRRSKSIGAERSGGRGRPASQCGAGGGDSPKDGEDRGDWPGVRRAAADSYVRGGGVPHAWFRRGSAKIRELKAGQSYIEHIPPDWIDQCVREGSFTPTADMRPHGRSRRPVDLRAHAPEQEPGSRPDLHRGDGPARLPRVLRPGQLVVLESTTYPGTTRDVVLPILEARGLTLGRDFFLAYQSRAGRPGQSGLYRRQHSQGGRRHRTR